MRVLLLLSVILKGESSSELVLRSGVLVRRLAWFSVPAWLRVDVPGAAVSSSSKSSRVEDCLLGGCSGGSLPCIIASILSYSSWSSSAISGALASCSASSDDVVENPWKEPLSLDSTSASASPCSDSSELDILSGGLLVLVRLMRFIAP